MTDENSDQSECEALYSTASMIETISNPTNEEILDAARMFYDSAMCFDKQGDRKRSASCFTLAGEFYLSVEENSKAAECYGKAVLRNLMANDMEAAKIILDKGEAYGDIFDTFNFRMAKDSYARHMSENLEDEVDILQDKETLFDTDSLNYDLELPDQEYDELFDLKLEEIDLSNSKAKTPFQFSENDLEAKAFISTYKGFSLSGQDISSDDSKYSQNIAFNLLKSVRQNIDKKIVSSGIGKSASGFIKDLEADSKFIRKDLVSEIDLDETQKKAKTASMEGIDESITLESDFVSISEIIADDDDLEEIEIHDSIPFAWQIKTVDATGFELQSQNIDQETGSLIFTWKKDKLERGESARIQYVLRRRLQRTVVMISNKRVYVLNSFHSLEEQNDFSLAKIEFENPNDEIISHLLIEDIIPDELKVVSSNSSVERKNLQVYSTKEGLTYRWVLNELKPNEKVTVEYKLIEKPFTRWFEQVFDYNGFPALKVEKIAEPLIEYADNSYVIFYEVNPDPNFPFDSFQLKDEIPSNAELVSSYPLWFRPSVEESDDEKKYLVWSKIELEGKTRRFVVKVKIKDHFNPQEPLIQLPSPEYTSAVVSQKDDRAEGVIDLRKRMGLALVKE